MYKLLREIPCKTFTRLIDNMLNKRTIQVSWEIQSEDQGSNGQGHVLATFLFSLYIADMPETTSRKFGYAMAMIR